MSVTLDQLNEIMPLSRNLERFVDPINETLDAFEINTTNRRAQFLAHLAHESGQFIYMEELASGAAYDNRADLGNTNPLAVAVAMKNGISVGRYFKGHGPIQITGYTNHLKCGLYLGVDLVENPKLLCEPRIGCLGAGWFWHVYKNLNIIADAGTYDSLVLTTRRVNGGTNGLAERTAFWKCGMRVLA